MGEDRELERDVDVAFLGQLGKGRRSRLVKRVIKKLEERGIRASIQTNLNGEARTDFLNRTKIIFNVMRAPSDFHGLRFVLCAANKVLMISEPIADSRPFEPGKHLAVAPLSQLPERIEYYLKNEGERRQIAEAAHRLVKKKFSIQQMTGRILRHAAHLIQHRG